MQNMRRALYLSHGGGPLPLLGDSAHADMVACLQEIAQRIEKPSAIIVVSAHWEASIASITAASQPALLYDYSGFPPESYAIRYPCSGNPTLAHAIALQLEKANIPAQLTTQRGLDHGVFVPLKIMYPNADIPCVQLSLLNHLDASAHLKLGQALQGIAEPSLLLIGSGFSFHNMPAFFLPDTQESLHKNGAFQQWLQDTCTRQTLSEPERYHRLTHWETAPFARYCHPREEHLLPLHVCYGFTESACTHAYSLSILNKESRIFLWDTAFAT
jgi:aromatic ring-opening dioxygenase catalytic subunit (LigB family)